jgi:hypothetical protein
MERNWLMKWVSNERKTYKKAGESERKEGGTKPIV